MNEQEKYDWMVYVSCMTYNHAPYIVDAMNGFTMQETNFPFVCAIVDDASTDGEQEIIKQYLNEHFDLEDKNVVRQEETDDYVLTFARHKTNLNCYFAVFFLRYNHYSIKKSKVPYTSQWRDKAKYIAICEGDDYWTYSKKLQMQVDFLEKNLQTGLVYTEIDRYIQKESLFEKDFFKTKPIKNTHDDFLLNSWFLAPCTWLIRSELSKKIPDLDLIKCFKGDTLMLLTYSKYSQVYFVNEVTSVYRVLNTSASHFDDYHKKRLFWRRNVNTRMFFLQDKKLSFRLKFWRKVFKNGRPSFRTQKDKLHEWLCDGFADFFRVLFIKKTAHSLISQKRKD